jgi:hypothetical protein
MVLLFLVAFVPRAIYVVSSAQPGPVVFAEVDSVSRGFLRNGTLSDVFGSDTGPTAFVAPAIPMAVAGAYKILGVHTIGAAIAVRLLSVLALALTCALIPMLAHRSGFRAGSGAAAAWILAALPLNRYLETSAEGEHVLAALAIVLLGLALTRLRAGSWSPGCCGAEVGILSGAAALVSPVVLPVLGISFGGAWVARLAPRGRILASASLAAAACAVILAPWTVRNLYLLHTIVPVRSNFGLELALGNHDRANGLTRGGIPVGARGDFFHNMHPNESGPDPNRWTG